MRKNYLPFLCLGMLSLSLMSMAERINLPVVELHGKQYYMYEAKKNQTFFNIANDFNWNLDELMRVNSKVMSPIAKGTKIYYPYTVGDHSEVGYYLDDESTAVEPEVLSHLVKKGETVYSISRMYSVPVDLIYSLNPASRDGIKAGEILQVKEGKKNIPNGKNPRFYVVKNGDTLYQLARTFNTTVAEILSYNPGISERNFKAGSTIKIPSRGEGLKMDSSLTAETRVVGFSSYKVNKNEDWEIVADKTGVSVDDLKNANSRLSRLKNNMIIGVPELVTDTVMKTVVTEDPREQTITGVGEIYSDVHGISSQLTVEKPVKIGLVLAEPMSKKDIDFTRGFLSGIDKLKSSNYRINLRVFDGASASDALIDSLGTYGANILFTTYERNTPDYFADYALVTQTPVVNTFDVKDEHYLDNPYFINILSPSNYFNDEIANNVVNRIPGATLIVVGNETDSNDLLDALEEKWDGPVVRLASPGSLEEYTFTSGKGYLIFGNVSKKDDIAALCSSVEKIKEDNIENRISLLGRPNWVVFDESLKEPFQKAEVMIPARFYFDKNAVESKEFLRRYQDNHKMVPARSFPMYSAMGYDEAIYFIPSIAQTGGDVNKFRESRSGVQSDFDFFRPENWTGMINPLVYLIRFSPYGLVEKIKVK